jgi:predicted dehydrogenase
MRTNTSTELLKVGFIGGGIDSAIGRAHFAALNIDRKYSLDAGLFSIDRDANYESGKFYGVAVERVYESVSQFLSAERENLDAVVVLSPTPLHLEHINQVFDVGLPVISEKSLCTNSKDAHLLAQRAAAEKRFLSVTFTYTGYPMVREIKKMIEDGELGKLLSIHFEMQQESFIREGISGAKPQPQPWRQLDYELPSVTLDLGSHVLNLLEFVTGDQVASICGLANHAGDVATLIDNVSAIGEMRKGAALSLSWNKVALGKRNGLAFTIFGSAGAVSWAQEEPEYIQYAGKNGSIQRIDRSHPMIRVASEGRYQRFKVGHPAGYIEAFANLYSDIGEQLSADQTGVNSLSPYTHNAENSAEGLRILETLHESAISKKWLEIKR